MAEPGRNDLCWCGSGKKYKKCHLGREQKDPVNPYEMAGAQRKLMSQAKCSHPLAGAGSCHGKIIQAHSIRRAADLQALAVDGHVIELHVDFQTLKRTNGLPEAKLIGINQASTFRGFCAKHDAEAFAPLEISPFTGTPEQCFLLLFRAWCRETYAKEGQARALELWGDVDKGRTLAVQTQIQGFLSAHGEGIRAGLRDVHHYKAILDAAFIVKDYARVQSVIFEMGAPFPLACSGAFYPYHDIVGREIQGFDVEVTPQPLALTILNEGQTGFAVLSWFRQSPDAPDAPTAFADALRKDGNVSDSLCRIAFGCLENVFAKPDWWELLTPEQQSDGIARMVQTALPTIEVPADYLTATVPPLLSLSVVRAIAV